MYVFKGFVVNSNFVDNTVGQVAVMGELSPHSATYSKEKGFYKNDAISPDITAISFVSALDDTAQPVDAQVRDRTLTILKWIWDKVNLGVEIFADEFLLQILEQFQASASNFQCGAIVSDSNGHWVPEWVSWVDSALNAAGTTNLIKMWFVDASFQAQFDNTWLTVIPPLDNLDDFFKTGAQVEALIKSRDVPTMVQKYQDARAGKPESAQVALEYDYIDPLNASRIVPTNWGVLIYGEAGNNIDTINDALVDYILANSTHPREDWVKILPDLFKRTEFILLPFWDQYAIPDRAQQTGIYATVTNVARAVALMKEEVPAYPAAHIDSYFSLMANPFKNLMLGVIGSTENRNNWYEIHQFFSDILSVASTSTDFGRMSQATQGFLLKLNQMLITAEKMGPFTDIPKGYTRVTRDGKLYIVLNYLNVHFLVAAKQNLTQVIPPLQ